MPQITDQNPKLDGRAKVKREAPDGSVKQGAKIATYGKPKCLGRGTPVLMYDGTIKEVEDVEVGDELMGPDSRPRRVLETTQGEGPLYVVTPTKGDPWICNEDHVLTLTGTCRHMGKVRDVSVIQYLRELADINSDPCWRLLRANGVDFAKQDAPLPVPPYLVGLWLGDGNRKGSSLTNSKPAIREYCQQVAPEMGLVCKVTPYNNTFTMDFSAPEDGWQGRPGRNLLRTFVRNECRSEAGYKKIPHAYLTASRQVRREILAGILDTDGKDTKSSHTSVNVTGEAYRDGLLFLCRSLGLAAYVSDSRTFTCVNGRVSTYWLVSISGHLDAIPTKIKKFPPRRQEKRVTVTGFEIDELDEINGEFFGFTLDGDGRFLLGDFTVTHNSGKTRLICSMPKPLLLIGTEDGTESVATSRKRKKKLPCGAEVMELSLRGKPTGVDFVRLYDTAWLNELIPLARDEYATVGLDHGGGLQDLIVKELLNLNEVPLSRTFGMMQESQWGVVNSQFKEIIGRLLTLSEQSGTNVGIIAHEREFRPKEGSQLMTVSVSAALTPGTARWLGGAVSYFVQTFVRQQMKRVKLEGGEEHEVPSGKFEFCLRIGQHEVFETGFRYPGGVVPQDVIVDPSWDKIKQLIDGAAKV